MTSVKSWPSMTTCYSLSARPDKRHSDEDHDELFITVDKDNNGDLSADELSDFEEKMKTLFSRLQQMGSEQSQSVADATHQTNDANLNLSARI